MGKPLGLGSIKIQVVSVKLRNIRLENGSIVYSNQETEDYKVYYTGKINDCETQLFQLTKKETQMFVAGVSEIYGVNPL